MPQFITDDGVKLFYEEYGQKNGKPVVLIHGLACTHEYFKEQIPVLAKEHRVIAYDLRGNGKEKNRRAGYGRAVLFYGSSAFVCDLSVYRTDCTGLIVIHK